MANWTHSEMNVNDTLASLDLRVPWIHVGCVDGELQQHELLLEPIRELPTLAGGTPTLHQEIGRRPSDGVLNRLQDQLLIASRRKAREIRTKVRENGQGQCFRVHSAIFLRKETCG